MRWGCSPIAPPFPPPMPSGENPADLPTRGLMVPEIEHSRFWWNGPDWLVSLRDSWPKWQPPQPVLQDVEKTRTARVIYECSNVASHSAQDKNLSVCGINVKEIFFIEKASQSNLLLFKVCKEAIMGFIVRIEENAY